MKYIVTVRGRLKSADENQSRMAHDAAIDKLSPIGKPLGSTGHRAYLKVQDRREFLAIDVWDNMEGPQKLFSDPNLAAEFARLFDGQPEVTFWGDSGWSSY